MIKRHFFVVLQPLGLVIEGTQAGRTIRLI